MELPLKKANTIDFTTEDNFMKLKPIFKGLLSLIPGMQRTLAKLKANVPSSADYCYGVWLKHLTMLWANGLKKIPEKMIELGPGNSLGTGLASLLSGINHYYALDVVKQAKSEHNLKVFDELAQLFSKRSARPNKGWPDYDSYLDENFFPSHILTEEILNIALSRERIESIRHAITDLKPKNDTAYINYVVPWTDEKIIEKESTDLIISHSVMEHVTDIERCYKILFSWLRSGGMMSHQVDFRSHGTSKKWNGYWKYSGLWWKIIVGKLPYLINRQPCSEHIRLIKKNGFKIVCLLKRYEPTGIKRSHLSQHWKNISDDDLACSGIFVQAIKP